MEGEVTSRNNVCGGGGFQERKRNNEGGGYQTCRRNKGKVGWYTRETMISVIYI